MTMTAKTPEEILATEFSERFVKGMKDRMVVSFFKYGAVSDAYPHKVDAIASLKKRLDKYAETGNTEWLMDVANFAMIEFMLPRHSDAHFKGTDSDASPGRERLDGKPADAANKEAAFQYRHEGD